MKSKTIIILSLICFLFIGCSSAIFRHKRYTLGKKYISEIPSLVIEFSHEISKLRKVNDTSVIMFQSPGVSNVYVESILIQSANRSNFIFYSLEQIATNLHLDYIESVYFDNHKWGKFTAVIKKKWRICGYFTRKDKWLIVISRRHTLDDDEVEGYREYQKTLKWSEADKRIINDIFNDLIETIVSINGSSVSRIDTD